MKSSPFRRGFTLVELLVVITIIVVLAAIGFMGSAAFLKRAAAVKDIDNMKGIWSSINLYTGEHGGMLPGPLFSGQRPKYTTNAKNGRLAYFISTYLGYDKPKDGEVIEPMVSSWQKTTALKDVPNYFFRTDVPLDDSNSTFRPWGYAYASEPLSMAGAMSKMNPSRTWAFTDLDQLHPDAAGAGWLQDTPTDMAHGDYRLAGYFDGHIGKVDKNNDPK